MEHNEYAIHRLVVRRNQEVREWVYHDESRLLGHESIEHPYVVIAPSGPLGDALVDIHLQRTFRHVKPLPAGANYEVLERSQEPINAIVRFDDARRGRM